MTPVNILYVEDSDDLRDTIGMLLEAPGRNILSCATAEEALSLLTQYEVELVITDVSLPGMSGTDLCRQLLASDPDRWVVLCSGYQFNHGLNALGPHVRSLLKPFELEELEALLTSVESSLTGPSLA